MTTTDLDVPVHAVAVGAHPDDVEFGCGGTLAKWARGGARITHIVCTDGSKGSWDAATDQAELVSTREREQQDASRTLGGSGDVVFLRAVDGELAAAYHLRERLAWWIRKLRPDVLLGHDPWKRYRLHPDHRAAGFLLTDAFVAARDPHFHREHFTAEPNLAPHRPSELLLFEADEPDHVEDISATIATKFDALMCHRSQLLSTMSISDADDARRVSAFRERLTARAAEAGALASLPAGEAFKRVDRL